jgi:hypothetical protein
MIVMAGLDPVIHAVQLARTMTRMRGSSPRMII